MGEVVGEGGREWEDGKKDLWLLLFMGGQLSSFPSARQVKLTIGRAEGSQIGLNGVR